MKKSCNKGGHVDGHHGKHHGEMKHHRAKGGHVNTHEPHEEDGETPEEPLKKGGAAKKKEHHAHHAHGGAPKKRMDKRARGGKVGSPSHPLSGAAPSNNRPGFSEKQKIGKEMD